MWHKIAGMENARNNSATSGPDQKPIFVVTVRAARISQNKISFKHSPSRRRRIIINQPDACNWCLQSLDSESWIRGTLIESCVRPI